jgi:hypothetical protein
MGDFRVMLSDGIFLCENNQYVLEGYELPGNIVEVFGSALGYARNTFCEKYNLYGNSFINSRIFSYTEQLYIKLIRIRTIEDSGINHVGDSLLDDWTAVMNYSVVALVHIFGLKTKDLLESKSLESKSLEISLAEFLCYYDREIYGCISVLKLKNGDYNDIWKELRLGCITDFVLTKIQRLRFMEGEQGKDWEDHFDVYVSIYRDIFNYGLFVVSRLLSKI